MIVVPVVPLDDYIVRIHGKLAIKVGAQVAEPFIVAGGLAVFCQSSDRRTGILPLSPEAIQRPSSIF